MFSYVKALVSRVVLGPSDKDEIHKKKENGNRNIWSDQDTREMIQLIQFTSGDPGSQGLDIFVEVGTVNVEPENTAEESDEAEEVTEDTSKKEMEDAQYREVSWKSSERESMRRKRLRRMSPVDEKDVETVKEVVAEQLEAEGEINQDEQDSMCRPNKLDFNPGSSVVDNILILSSPDPDSSPCPSPEPAAGQKSLSPISDSDPVAELFPVKVKRSFTLRPTLRSLNRWEDISQLTN